MPTFIQQYFAKFDVNTVLENLFEKVVSLILLFALFFIAKKLVHVAVQKILKPSFQLAKNQTNRQKTISRLVENTLNYMLYFLLFYWVLSILGVPVSSLLAGAGIAGVAIGLGAQGFLSDLVNGFFIMLEHQFDVGDTVILTNGPINISGIVSSVGIRTTQVRGADGTLHFIPNRNILVVSNQSRGDMRVQLDLPLPATVDLGRVYEVIEQVHERELGNYPVLTKAPVILGPQVDAHGKFSFRIHLYVENGQQIPTYHAFYKLYQEALLASGIELMRPLVSSI